MPNDNEQFEKMPSAETREAAEQNPLQQERAEAWGNAFPESQAQNPWLEQSAAEANAPTAAEASMPAETAETSTSTMTSAPAEALGTDASTDEAEGAINTTDLAAMEAQLQQLDENGAQTEASPEDTDGPEDENPVAMSANTPNQLRNTNNEVTQALEKSWNEGNGGGIEVPDAIDALDAKLSDKDVSQLAHSAENTISRFAETKANGAIATENKDLEEDFGDQSAPADAQLETSLHDASIAAGTTAIGAQADAKIAIENSLNNNDTASLEAAQKNLADAQAKVDTLTDIAHEATDAVEKNPGLVNSVNTLTEGAQGVLNQTKDDLEQAIKDANARQEELAANAETVNALTSTGEMSAKDINEQLADGASIDEIAQENNIDPLNPQAPQAPQDPLSQSPNISQETFDPTNPNPEPLNPEIIEDDRENLISIFG